MAGLLQRLIELGEEPKIGLQQLASSSSVTDDSASKEELRAQNLQLQSILADQKCKYEELMGDSTKLRSEYEAFRQKAIRERRQLMQQRTEDKRMLEEIRRAGSTGQVDETYVKEMDAKVLELQRQLRRAQDEAQKAFQRQREAEHARAAAEASGKDEIQELYQKVEKFKDAMRKRNGQFDTKLSEPHEAAKAGAALEAHDSLRPTNDPEVNGKNGKQGAVPAHDSSGEDDPVTNDGIEFSTEGGGTASSSELSHLRAELEEARWESVEASRKIAETRAEAETWRARAEQHAAALESAAEEHAAKERALREAVREAGELQREAHEAMVRGREEAAKQTVLADAAESLSKTASSALQEQRDHYERLLCEAKDSSRAQQQLARSLEAALQDAREERREQSDLLDGVRSELERAQRAVGELDAMQAQSQQLMALRERELCVGEQERQTLRARLREEEAAHRDTRHRVAELEAEQHGAEPAAHGAAEEKEKSENKEKNEVRKEEKEGGQPPRPAVRLLQAQLDDLIAQSARFACYRKEQAARTQQLEGRIRELEAERAAADTGATPRIPVAPSSPRGATGAAALEMLYAAPSERTRQQFVAEAITTARKLRLAAIASKRRFVVILLVCLLMVIMFVNFLAAPNVDRSESSAEAMLQRYTMLQKENSRLVGQLKKCNDRCGHARLA